MNLILDTHTFIWFIEGSAELSPIARLEIENPQNQCFVSIVSLWEMSIKIGLGKLGMQSPFESVTADISNNGFELLPLLFEHLLENSRLDWHHKDPFDRLLAAQCIRENMPLLSRDVVFEAYFEAYACNRIW